MTTATQSDVPPSRQPRAASRPGLAATLREARVTHRSGHAVRLALVFSVHLGCTPAPQPTETPSASSTAHAFAVIPSASPDPEPSASDTSPAGAASNAARVKDVPLDIEELEGLRIGMRVRSTKWDRGLDPTETGHPREIGLNKGHTGRILRFMNRTSSGFTFPVVLVAWDAQKWHEWVPPYKRMQPGKAYSSEEINRMYDEGTEVSLPSFEAATHPEILAPL